MVLADFKECQQGPLHQHGCKGAAITILLTAVSLACFKDAAITIFLTAVSGAGCKDATTTNFLDLDIFSVHF